MVDHAIEEIALVVNVVVQGHCLDAQFGPEFPHRYPVEAMLVSESDSSFDDPIA
jgi:hypothetical protein